MATQLLGIMASKTKAAVNTYKTVTNNLDNLKNLGTTVLNMAQSKKSNSSTDSSTDIKMGDEANTSDQNLTPLVTTKDIKNDTVEVIDADWVSSRFMVPDEDLSDLDAKNRYFSTARWKYYDTSLGGHIAINPKPQYTRYADIRQPRGMIQSLAQYPEITLSENTYKTANKDIGFTLGRFYSESIDDNATTIFLTFGRAKFNSLLSFLIRSVNAKDVHVANTGRPLTKWYTAGQWVGGITTAIFFPAISTMIWILRGIGWLLGVGANSYDFYYMEENMKDYWYCVNNLLTRLAVEMGLVGGVFNSDDKAERVGATLVLDKEDLLGLKEVMGEGIIDPETGWIDIFAIVTRTQRVFNQLRTKEYERVAMGWDGGDFEKSFIGYVKDKQAIKNDLGSSLNSFGAMVNYHLSFSNWKRSIHQGAHYDPDKTLKTFSIVKVDLDSKNENLTDKEKKQMDDAAGNSTGSNINQNIYSLSKANSDRLNSNNGEFTTEVFDNGIEAYSQDGFLLEKDEYVNINDSNDGAVQQARDAGNYGDPPKTKESDSWISKAFATTDSVIRDGAMFAVFNVDYQGSVSESVSNSVSDMALKDGMKSVARAVRDVKFNLAGGNILGEVQQTITNGLSDFLKGSIDGLTVGVSNIVAGLFGGAYVDIPKKWDDSEISFPQITYKTKLISPYGNVISQFMDIYIPLCMLMAGSFPQSAGSRSYTSPFLCSIFNRGVQKINLGMITSLSIERGTSNLAFNKQKQPLAIDVSFTVTDFSNLVTSPMSGGVFKDLSNFEFDDHAPLQRYINTLASRDLWTDMYLLPKLKNVFRTKMKQVKALISPNQWGFRVGDAVYPLVNPFVARKMIGPIQASSLNTKGAGTN